LRGGGDGFDERNLDHDDGEKNLEPLGEKIHPRDETVGLEMTENGG